MSKLIVKYTSWPAKVILNAGIQNEIKLLMVQFTFYISLSRACTRIIRMFTSCTYSHVLHKPPIMYSIASNALKIEHAKSFKVTLGFKFWTFCFRAAAVSDDVFCAEFLASVGAFTCRCTYTYRTCSV